MDENSEAADGVGERLPLHGKWDDMGSSVRNVQRISLLSFVPRNQVKISLLELQNVFGHLGCTIGRKNPIMYQYTRMQSVGNKWDFDLITLV